MAPRKPLLLIADDDPEILSLLSMRFAKAGYEVLEAQDGVQTLRLVHTRRPDALVLDVMMPGKTGWEVTREVRSDPSLSAVGIVMLTAIGERVNEMTSPLYGADEFVDKPFDFNDLEARVKKAIERRRKLV
jgi:DNA-binding response OmpR family regulator